MKEACAYQWKCCHLEGRQVAFWQDDCHCSELAVEHESDFRAPTWPNTMGIGYTGMFLQKISKAVLAHHLQKGTGLAEFIPAKSAIVIDGMSLVQKVGQNYGTFGERAAVIHSMVFKEGSHSSRIDIVFSTYRDMSIKNVERNLRGDDQGLQRQNLSEKQWKKFCGNPTIKTA